MSSIISTLSSQLRLKRSSASNLLTLSQRAETQEPSPTTSEHNHGVNRAKRRETPLLIRIHARLKTPPCVRSTRLDWLDHRWWAREDYILVIFFGLFVPSANSYDIMKKHACLKNLYSSWIQYLKSRHVQKLVGLGTLSILIFFPRFSVFLLC